MKNFRVLVVDDNASLRYLVPEMMRRLFPDCHVDVAGTPLEAFRFLEQPFEVVISDFNLKDSCCSGVGIICVAKRKYPNALTILMSGNFKEDIAGTSACIADAGNEIDHFLEKPFKMSELGEIIQKFLNEKERRSEQRQG